MAGAVGADNTVPMPQVLELRAQEWALYAEHHILKEYQQSRGLGVTVMEEPILHRQLMDGLRCRSEPGDHKLRRLRRAEWIGAGVQYFHDCHYDGYSTFGILMALRESIRDTQDPCFIRLAEPYLQGIASQIADYNRCVDGPTPPTANEWTRGMSTVLWLLYREHGLLEDHPADIAPNSSATGACDDLAWDQGSLAPEDKPN